MDELELERLSRELFARDQLKPILPTPRLLRRVERSARELGLPASPDPQLRGGRREKPGSLGGLIQAAPLWLKLLIGAALLVSAYYGLRDRLPLPHGGAPAAHPSPAPRGSSPHPSSSGSTSTAPSTTAALRGMKHPARLARLLAPVGRPVTLLARISAGVEAFDQALLAFPVGEIELVSKRYPEARRWPRARLRHPDPEEADATELEIPIVLEARRSGRQELRLTLRDPKGGVALERSVEVEFGAVTGAPAEAAASPSAEPIRFEVLPDPAATARRQPEFDQLLIPPATAPEGARHRGRGDGPDRTDRKNAAPDAGGPDRSRPGPSDPPPGDDPRPGRRAVRAAPAELRATLVKVRNEAGNLTRYFFLEWAPYPAGSEPDHIEIHAKPPGAAELKELKAEPGDAFYAYAERIDESKGPWGTWTFELAVPGASGHLLRTEPVEALLLPDPLKPPTLSSARKSDGQAVLKLAPPIALAGLQLRVQSATGSSGSFADIGLLEGDAPELPLSAPPGQAIRVRARSEIQGTLSAWSAPLVIAPVPRPAAVYRASLSGPKAIEKGACAGPFEVELLDPESGRPAAAASPASIELRASPGDDPADFFATSDCSRPTERIEVAAGAGRARFFVRATTTETRLTLHARPSGSAAEAAREAIVWARTDLANACVLKLNLDEGPGAQSFADSSGRGHSATCAPGFCPASGAPGRSGNAATFERNASTAPPKPQGIVVADGPDFRFGAGETVTLSAWIRPSSLAAGNVILSKGQDNSIERAYLFAVQGGSSRLYFLFTDQAQPVPTAGFRQLFSRDAVASAGTWAHVAVTHTFGAGAASRLYLNGEPIAANWYPAGGRDALPRGNSLPLRIGSEVASFPNETFAGEIDEVLVCRRALTAQEMLGQYWGALERKQP